jgi:hypothetical protein
MHTQDEFYDFIENLETRLETREKDGQKDGPKTGRQFLPDRDFSDAASDTFREVRTQLIDIAATVFLLAVRIGKKQGVE